MVSRTLLITAASVALLTTMTPSSTTAAERMYLVRDGAVRSAIVLQGAEDEDAQRAVEELQHHVARATGVRLPVVKADAAGTLPPGHVRVLVGAGPLTESLGLDAGALQREAYRVFSDGRHLVLLGRPGDPSPTTRWAAGYVLDRYLGVRWLWPGETGTYVPKSRDVAVPASVDVTERPPFEARTLRQGSILKRRSPEESPRLITDAQHEQVAAEAAAWQRRHQMGSRGSYSFGHSYTEWWDRYAADRPEVFAKGPPGSTRPTARAERVKLCVSEPMTARTVIEEWTRAGRPDNWPVAPNDGSPGFCTCDDCRAADGKPEQKPEDLWRGRGDMTGRYVRFWNTLLGEMRRSNPNVTLSSYAYSTYKNPPEDPNFRFEPGMVLGIVGGYDRRSYAMWDGWRRAGASLYLRPNWWHTGVLAPVIPLHEMGDYFRHAADNGMLGFDFDSLHGYWGTRAPMYYLVARMSYRRDLTTDEVIDEFTSAFGSARAEAREYVKYWEDFTTWARFSIVGGGGSDEIIDENGPYMRLLRERKMDPAPLGGGWRAIPLLYTDEVLGKGLAILDRAEQKLGADEHEARARVAFLRDGLRHLRATRDVLTLGYSQLRPKGATRAEYRQKAKELRDLRAELTPRHVIWGEVAYYAEQRRHAPTVEERVDTKSGDPLVEE